MICPWVPKTHGQTHELQPSGGLCKTECFHPSLVLNHWTAPFALDGLNNSWRLHHIQHLFKHRGFLSGISVNGTALSFSTLSCPTRLVNPDYVGLLPDSGLHKNWVCAKVLIRWVWLGIKISVVVHNFLKTSNVPCHFPSHLLHVSVSNMIRISWPVSKELDLNLWQHVSTAIDLMWETMRNIHTVGITLF